MRSRIALNLLLFMLVAALGLFVYLKPTNTPPLEHPLSKLSPRAIQHIKIEKTGQPTITLEQRSGTWFMTAPFAARGDPLKINALLDILNARSLPRFNADHLDRYELDTPLLTLTIDQQIFHFGTINTLNQSQYINTDNSVFMIPTKFFATALSQPADFASKKLLGENESPTGFDLPDQQFTRNINGTWVSATSQTQPSQDQLNNYAEEWRLASALITQPNSQSKPLESIAIHLATGKTIAIKILMRQPELVLLRTDENLQYHFPPDLAQRLLLTH